MCDDVKLAVCHVISNDKIRTLQCNVFLRKMHLCKMRNNFRKCTLLLFLKVNHLHRHFSCFLQNRVITQVRKKRNRFHKMYFLN